jgi:hypothetical protein
MKSFIPTTLVTLALSTQATAALLRTQEVLTSTTEATAKVPGHNNAYYTQIEPDNQLFGVRELVVYPNPPSLYVRTSRKLLQRLIHHSNEHIFLYLDGWIVDQLPGLSDATLEISGFCPEYWRQEPVKITEFRSLIVRHDDEYGGPLTSLDNNVSRSL